MEQEVAKDLNQLIGRLEGLVTSRKLAQQVLGDIAVAAAAIHPLQKQAREQILHIRRQPQIIIEAARALIQRSM